MIYLHALDCIFSSRQHTNIILKNSFTLNAFTKVFTMRKISCEYKHEHYMLKRIEDSLSLVYTAHCTVSVWSYLIQKCIICLWCLISTVMYSGVLDVMVSILQVFFSLHIGFHLFAYLSFVFPLPARIVCLLCFIHSFYNPIRYLFYNYY